MCRLKTAAFLHLRAGLKPRLFERTVRLRQFNVVVAAYYNPGWAPVEAAGFT